MLSKVYKLYFWFCSRLWLFLGISQLEGTPAHLLALALITPPENITSCSWPVNKKTVAPKTVWIWLCQPRVVGIVLPFLFHCLFFYKIFYCLPIFFFFFFLFKHLCFCLALLCETGSFYMAHQDTDPSSSGLAHFVYGGSRRADLCLPSRFKMKISFSFFSDGIDNLKCPLSQNQPVLENDTF